MKNITHQIFKLMNVNSPMFCIKNSFQIICCSAILIVLLFLNSQLNAQIIFQENFDERSPGVYTEAMMISDFEAGGFANVHTIAWPNGHGFIVGHDSAYGGTGHSLRIQIGTTGQLSNPGGASFYQHWVDTLSYDSIYFSFRWKFQNDFDPVMAGKFGGGIFASKPACDGCNPSSGVTADGTTGFKDRTAWNSTDDPSTATTTDDIDMINYIYHLGMPGVWGDNIYWDEVSGTRTWAVRDQWYQIEIFYKLNTPGVADGILRTWLDGTIVVNKTNFLYRAAGTSWHITAMMLENYYGCTDNPACAPNKNEYGYIDDIVISTERIGSGNQTSPLTQDTVEAESGILTTPMETVSDAGASGGTCILTPERDNGTSSFNHMFDTATKGYYKIYARVNSSDVASNSFFVQIDDQSEQIWDINTPFGMWVDDELSVRGNGTSDNPQYDPYIFELAPGSHTITFRGREANSKLDYFYFVEVPKPPQNLHVQAP